MCISTSTRVCWLRSRPVSAEHAQLVQDQLSDVQIQGRPTELNFWCRSEIVVTTDGDTTFEDLSAPEATERDRNLREMFNSEMASAPP